jgi:hypothetical protein
MTAAAAADPRLEALVDDAVVWASQHGLVGTYLMPCGVSLVLHTPPGTHQARVPHTPLRLHSSLPRS